MVEWVAVELLGMRRKERSEPKKLSILHLRQERDENVPESVPLRVGGGPLVITTSSLLTPSCSHLADTHSLATLCPS